MSVSAQLVTITLSLKVLLLTCQIFYLQTSDHCQGPRRGWGWGGLQFPHFSSLMKISMLLLRRSVNKSCKDTKTADESDAQIAGNGIEEVLNFKIFWRQPSL